VLHGKKATLNEFYQTVAGLSDQGRAVVVTGEPSAMNGEAARFKSELQWGLVANIEQPSVEDRVRFVSTRAGHQGVELPGEVQHYLAIRVKGSMRDLEGAINRVTALARISREPLTIDFAARALQPIAPVADEAHRVLPPELISAVCHHLNITPDDLASSRRDRRLTYARHIAMYLLRTESGLTYSTIAHLLGKKDHSTVVHACSQLDKEAGNSPDLRADLDAIRATIHTPGTAN
jgi:chromosomal replication initiator protein